MHSDWSAYLCLCRHHKMLECAVTFQHVFLSSFSTLFHQYHRNTSRCRRRKFPFVQPVRHTVRVDTTRKKISCLISFCFSFFMLLFIQPLFKCCTWILERQRKKRQLYWIWSLGQSTAFDFVAATNGSLLCLREFYFWISSKMRNEFWSRAIFFVLRLCALNVHFQSQCFIRWPHKSRARLTDASSGEKNCGSVILRTKIPL